MQFRCTLSLSLSNPFHCSPPHSHYNLHSMATNPLALSCSSKTHTPPHFPLPLSPSRKPLLLLHSNNHRRHYAPKSLRVTCKATQVSVAEESSSSGDDGGGNANWVPVVPLSALPRGERRVIIQDGETILLLWYKNQVFAIENRSPAEGAYSEGLLNAKLTQDGCIVCPTTDSTFDLRTGEIKEWYPKNPVLRVLTPSLRALFVYPVKTDEQNIYISMRGAAKSDAATEIVFSGKAQPGITATDVNVDEVRMVVDEGEGGFGFTGKNEIINGKAAVIGFLLLLDFELLTGPPMSRGSMDQKTEVINQRVLFYLASARNKSAKRRSSLRKGKCKPESTIHIRQ